MSCNCCFSVDLSQCQEGIFLNGSFTPLTEYRVIVTGKQGVYEASFTSDADGTIQIEPSEYPAGMFNPYAGELKIEVYLGAVKQDFTLSQMYDCVIVNVIPGTYVNDQIGLP